MKKDIKIEFEKLKIPAKKTSPKKWSKYAEKFSKNSLKRN